MSFGLSLGRIEKKDEATLSKCAIDARAQEGESFLSNLVKERRTDYPPVNVNQNALVDIVKVCNDSTR